MANSNSVPEFPAANSRWQLTDEIFNQALVFPESERPQFLIEVCGADEELRGEVESLLRYASDSESYLQAVVQATVLEFRASVFRQLTPFPPQR